MIVKLVRRRIKESYPIEVYDIYIGIRRMFLPFRIQWFLDAKGLSEKEAKERISYLSVKGTKLVTTIE